MRRWLFALVVLALVAAACGSDDGEAAETTAAPEVAEATAPPAAPIETTTPPETTMPPETTAPPETTVPAATGSTDDLAITEVVFGDHVTITNLGDTAVEMEGVWLCNRPSYAPLTGILGPGESAVMDAGSLSGLGADSGEVALYTSSDFGDSDAIVDYVSWGGGGGRASVATGAGIWPDGDSVAGGGAGITAPTGGESAADWSSQ